MNSRSLFSFIIITHLLQITLEAAVSISPAVITNNFQGNLVLQVTGVPNGSSLRVEKIPDFNTNSAVDLNEFVIDSFTVQDGQIPAIGGIRNLNVPGDEDATINGSLRIEIPYPGIYKDLEKVAGHFTYRLILSSGTVFGTTHLEVRQQVTTQGIRGKLTTPTGSPMPNAAVLLVENSNGGMFTDAGGNFTIYTAPGSHFVYVLNPGSYSYFSPTLVASNTFTTLNITSGTGSNSVSGRIVEQGNTNPVRHLLITAESEMGETSAAFTDVNGNFSLSVLPGDWEISPVGSALARRGLMSIHGEDHLTITQNISDVVIEIPRGTALIHGVVRGNGALLAQAIVEAEFNSGDEYKSEAITGLDGRYTLLAVAGNGSVNAEAPVRGTFFSRGQSFSISSNVALEINLDLPPVTARISGQVLDQNGTPISSISISACAATGGCEDEDLGADGRFEFGVTPGRWFISFSSEDLKDRGLVGPTPTIDVAEGQTVSNLVIRLRTGTNVVRGIIAEENGSRVSSLGISAFFSQNGTNYSSFTLTDENGAYELNVFADTWYISPNNFDLQQRGFISSPGTNLNIVAGETIINFTVQRPGAFAAGRVITDTGAPIGNANVFAFGPGPSSGTTTDANGNFQLGLDNGSWTIEISTSVLQQRNLIGPSIPVTILNNQSVSNLSLIARTPTSVITGRVQTQTGIPFSNLSVYAQATIANTNYFTSRRTDSSGNFSIPVINGTWSVYISCFDLQSSPYQCPPTQSITVNGANTNMAITILSEEPQLSGTTYTPGRFSFQVNSVTPGNDYVIRYSTNLTQWNVLTTINPAGNSFFFEISTVQTSDVIIAWKDNRR